MTLLQLKYIVTVAAAGTISEAAKQLYIAQPSLTSAIKELENELQKLTDRYVKDVDKLVEEKSKEILTV